MASVSGSTTTFKLSTQMSALMSAPVSEMRVNASLVPSGALEYDRALDGTKLDEPDRLDCPFDRKLTEPPNVPGTRRSERGPDIGDLVHVDKLSIKRAVEWKDQPNRLSGNQRRRGGVR